MWAFPKSQLVFSLRRFLMQYILLFKILFKIKNITLGLSYIFN